MFTESAQFRYVADPDLVAPRKWFHDYIERILDIYGQDHAIQREDLMLGELAYPTVGSFTDDIQSLERLTQQTMLFSSAIDTPTLRYVTSTSVR